MTSDDPWRLQARARALGDRRIILETGTAQPEAVALYTEEGTRRIPGFGIHRDSPMSRCFAACDSGLLRAAHCAHDRLARLLDDQHGDRDGRRQAPLRERQRGGVEDRLQERHVDGRDL